MFRLILMHARRFIEWCRAAKTEPFIILNMGTGTLAEALHWIEYCNGTGDTHYANLRRAHTGRAAPHNVVYWGLGNEMYGSWQIGQLSAEDYVKKAREFAKVMKWTDPTIKLVGCGENGWSAWDQQVIAGLAPFIDYYSLHLYTGSPHYYSNVLSPALVDFALNSTQAMIQQAHVTKRRSQWSQLILRSRLTDSTKSSGWTLRSSV